MGTCGGAPNGRRARACAPWCPPAKIAEPSQPCPFNFSTALTIWAHRVATATGLQTQPRDPCRAPPEGPDTFRVRYGPRGKKSACQQRSRNHYSGFSGSRLFLASLGPATARETVRGRTLFAGVPASKDRGTVTAVPFQLQHRHHHLGTSRRNRDRAANAAPRPVSRPAGGAPRCSRGISTARQKECQQISRNLRPLSPFSRGEGLR